jgi:hypothetical protein
LLNGAENLDELARRFLAVLAGGERSEIAAQAVSWSEYLTMIYPALPAGRFSSGMTPEFLWGQTQLRSRAGLQKLMERHAGHRYELVSVGVRGGIREYPGFGLHQDVRMTVRNETGQVQELSFFTSVLELGGVFKIYGFRQSESRQGRASGSDGE